MNIASYRDVSQIRARSLYHRPWFHSPPASIENRRLFRNAFLTFPMPPPVLSLRRNTNFPPCCVFAKHCKRTVVEGTVDVGVFGNANEGLCSRSVDLLVGF